MSPPQFNDGLPVYRKGQQTDGSTESQSREYYMPSPASQGTRITQAPHANHSSAFFTGPINPALMAFTNAHSAHSPQGMMATPPSTTYEGDDIDQFSYRDSPLSAAEALTSSSAHPSVSSPRDWSPIEAQPMTIDEAYRQQYLRNPDPELTFNHPSIAAPGRINQRVYPSNTGAMEQVEASFARATVQDTDHAMSSQSRSNPKSQGNGIQGPSEEGNSARLGQVAEHIGQDRPRGDEPYAQLIYRALMSVERRAMSLQQMYKWFTENTDKPAKSVNTGWQNSIRHNLSMNAAFTNREVEPEAGQGQSRSRSSKPQKEWFLEPWAYGGVQSTTRYRPKGTRRAKASTAENSRANRKGSSRAESGRRGGLTASKSKAKKAGQVQDQRQQQPAYTSDTQGNVQMGGIALATNMDYSYGVHDPMTSQQPMLPAPQSSFAFNPAADNTMAHMPQR
ncbi:hypothetical protein GGR52DRAFT_486429 [Hypoxylon sp. FL1284]|nr:hypothetical protein GGR52DRAFT_486429 [Hypoxylon sp. FL1284]